MNDNPDVESLICPHCKGKQLQPTVGGGATCTNCGKTSSLDEIMAATIALDPMTELEIGNVQLHEIFEGQMKAGFTERQSLYIVMSLATGNPGQAPRSS